MARRIKKSESKLIIAAIVAYPFVWLYQQIGIGGYALLIFGTGGIWVGANLLKKSRVNSDFEADALATLRNRLAPEDARAMNQKHRRTSARHAELLRFIQIFSDSIHLALNSNKRDTAESRMLLASETYRKSMAYRGIMSRRLKSEIDHIYREAESRFPEAMRFNVARSLLDKADSLKTQKAKSRYIDQALSIIEEGLSGKASDSTLLLSLAKEAQYKNSN